MQNNVTACQNAKCLSHTSIYVQCVFTYKSQSPNSVSPAASYYKTYEGTTPAIYSSGSTPASTTAAWAHLRALRDTDIDKDPVEPTHVPHVHGMPRERDRTTGVHAYVGTVEGVPRLVETNCMYIHLLMYRLHCMGSLHGRGLRE